MIGFQKLVLGELATNCYFIWDEEKRCLVIDPADEAGVISDWMEDRRLKPKAILATHCHFDHILAAMELKLMYKIPFIASNRDEFLIRRMNKSANYWLENQQRLVNMDKIDMDLDIRDEIQMGDLKIAVIKTPGHTPGSCCFLIREEKWLFSGDTIFADGVGRTDFNYSSEVDLKASLKKLKQLGGGLEVWPGHGESFRS